MNVVKELLTDHKRFGQLAALLILGELVLNVAVIERVPYTEIDWIAYNQEVAGFLGGERNYTNMRGDTGPLVYPAGFVYIFSGLHLLTAHGANVHLAQYIWLALYLVLLATVLAIYRRAQPAPPWAAVLLCASYRIHSLFVLRLFNDCWAVAFFYISVLLFTADFWSLGCLVYSLAVSVKMSVLLFAPGLLCLLVHRFGVLRTIPRLAICAVVQLVLGLPFLVTFPVAYIRGAFDLGRVFTYIWTVNWKFVPEDVFVSKPWAIALLVAHISMVAFFALRKWQAFRPQKSEQPLSATYILAVLATSNFAGIAFSRTLHYQFYTWFFHTLPVLVWLTPYHSALRVLVMLAIEVAFNVYPSTAWSSGILCLANIALLLGLAINNNFPSIRDAKAKKTA